MKKVFLVLLVAASFAACTSTETKTTETVEATAATVEHLYKPTYTDNFKMGDQKNVMLAEQFHKVLFEKDFKAAARHPLQACYHRLAARPARGRSGHHARRQMADRALAPGGVQYELRPARALLAPGGSRRRRGAIA